jgi:hypothetical protein
MSKQIFVFVVCGAHEHIDTIHYSLNKLQYFSDKEIIIITDSSRNEIPIIHNNIIDITTPENFNHHQASIYLKTGLHKFLPKGNLYCYLDTDVIALSKTVDEIFSHKSGTITFAPDHCRLHQFSPYAVNCGCMDENQKLWRELSSLLEKYGTPYKTTDPSVLHKQEELKRKFEFIKRNRFNVWQMAARYVLPGNVLQLDEDTFYNKRENFWFDAEGKVILYDFSAETISNVEKNSDWRWSNLKRRWISPAGTDIHQLQCNHLLKAIQQKFNITVTDNEWQHWNGGVFLFDDNSHTFMETWHSKTMEIFTDPYWKTRDQGTLIATAWQFGLQQSTMLSKKFNFIADYSNPKLMVSLDKRYITDDAFKTKYAPAFIHIFHHFGEEGWFVWNWVTGKLKHVLSEQNA